MSLPANWTLVPVTATYKNRDGTPASGWVTFESRQKLTIGGQFIVPKTITGVIDGSGYLSVQLPATDDPDLSVTGWAYLVTEHVDNGRPPFLMEVPYRGGTIDLATVAPAIPAPAQSVTSYLRASDLGITVAPQALAPISVRALGARGDGTNDDTEAFTAAIAEAALSRRPVFVPKGTYRIDLTHLPAGCRLYGEGESTILQPATAASGFMLNAAGDGVEVSHLWIDAPQATYANTVPLKASAVRRFYAHDLKITGGGSPFIGSQCTDSVVERLNVSDYANNGISFDGAGTARNKILLCNVDGSTSTGGSASIQVTDGTDCQIIGNTVVGGYKFGCYLGACTNSVMVGNTVRNTRLEGLQATDSSYCLITGNTAAWDGTTGQDFGISLWSTLAGGGKYNTISNNTVVRSGKAGIQIEGTGGFSTSYNTIIGNTIINPNWLNEANAAAIMLYGVNCIGTQVSDNYCFSDNGRMSYGVREVDGGGYPTDSVIKGNEVIGHTVARISKQATSTETHNGKRLTDAPWTPVITAEVGTITAASVSEATFYEMERMVYVSLAFTVTTKGTAAGAIQVTLPFNAQSGRIAALHCLNLGTGPAILKAETSAAKLLIRKGDSTTAFVDGGIYTVGGWYERD